MTKINKNKQMFTDEDVRVIYVLSVMTQNSIITPHEKIYIRQGLLGKDPAFRILGQLTPLADDFNSISEYVLLFLQNQRINDPILSNSELSPDTLNLIRNTSEDSSPNDEMIMHRKKRHQIRGIEDDNFRIISTLMPSDK